MTKYTPGPWKAQVRQNGSVWIQSDCSDFDGVRNIADINYRGTKNDEQREANAHLIAAAPEMLEALEAVYSDLDAVMPVELIKHFGASRNLIRSAIAKAKGE